MSDATKLGATASGQYKMPKAYLGPALWYHELGGEPMAAVITKNDGYRSVMISLLAPDNRGLIVHDGVRHVSDPELFRMPENKEGSWDYTDQFRLLLKVKEAVDALEVSGAELLKALGQ